MIKSNRITLAKMYKIVEIIWIMSKYFKLLMISGILCFKLNSARQCYKIIFKFCSILFMSLLIDAYIRWFDLIYMLRD